ncbi:MAG: DUF4375 domain-containing protein [Litoreibacter sp.]|uniref:DMP19 family protein n=1 Tax=Litoreibacter sp. TaxID=1969459 RepID=UPI0032979AA7
MLSLLKRITRNARPNIPAIYISQESLEPDAKYYDGMMELVDYTNSALHGALYLSGEFPVEAEWLYLADFYMAEVSNGGHSQFLSNDRAQPGGPKALPMALKGMELIGCAPLAELLDKLQYWVEANPEEAAAQNGFSNRAEALDDLDADFYALDRELFYTTANDWMGNSPVVEVLPKEDVGKALQGFAAANSQLPARRRINDIAALDSGLTTDTIASFRSCVAGATAKDKPFDVKVIKGGRPFGNPTALDDESLNTQPIMWSLETTTGPLVGVIGEREVEIFVVNSEDGMHHSVFNRPTVRVNEQIELAKVQKPARYAYEIGKKAFPGDPVARLGFLEAEQGPESKAAEKCYYFVVTQSGAQHLLLLQRDAAVMCDLAGETLLGSIKGKEFKALKAEDTSKLT